MKKYKKFIVYLLCAVLIIWYMAVMYKVFNPDVTAVYRQYFIEKTLADWPGPGGLDGVNPELDQRCLLRDN